MFGSWFVFVREKAKELWEWLHNLEAIKYDHGEALKRQRYEVSEETWYICACCKTFNLLFGLSVFIWSSVWIISLYSNTTYLNVQNVSLVFCGIFISTANTTVEFKKTCFSRMCEYFTMTFISCDTYSLMSGVQVRFLPDSNPAVCLSGDLSKKPHRRASETVSNSHHQQLNGGK